MHRFCFLLVFLSFLLMSQMALAQIPIPPTILSTGEIFDPDLTEISGVTPALLETGYWCHNDSGNDPILYRFLENGNVVQRVSLVGSEMVDWEAITSNGIDTLYLADAGDNDKIRGKYTIYAFPDPGDETDEIQTITAYPFIYPDGTSYDCEAIFWMQGKLYLITKLYTGENPAIFCLDSLVKGQDQEARFVGYLDVQQASLLGRIVTDASYSESRGELAVLTYYGFFLYSVHEEHDLLKPPSAMVSGFFGQSEGICYDGSQLLIVNESGTLWKYPVKFYAPETMVLNWLNY